MNNDDTKAKTFENQEKQTTTIDIYGPDQSRTVLQYRNPKRILIRILSFDNVTTTL